jgi:glycerophosphoryl diester phosphodiesterase
MTSDHRIAGLELGPRPWIVGHRGASGEAPENTIESFLLAIEQGAVMIELDLQLTRDGRLVALHDWDLLRTAGSETVGESATVAEIQALNVGRYQDRAATAPTIEEIFGALPAQFPLNLELKCRHADHQMYAAALASAVAEREQLLISSFDWDLLRRVRASLPEVPLGILSDEPAARVLATERDVGAASIHCNHERMTKAFVDEASRVGLPVLVYTVDDAAVARAQFAIGVAGVFTNYPSAMRKRVIADE